MRRGRRVARRVEHRAAADRDDVGVAAETGVVDRAVDVVDVARVVLDRFAARDDEHGRRQAEDRAMTVGVLGDVIGQIRMVIQYALIEDDDEMRRRLIGRAGQDVAQQKVGRRDDAGRVK